MLPSGQTGKKAVVKKGAYFIVYFINLMRKIFTFQSRCQSIIFQESAHYIVWKV